MGVMIAIGPLAIDMYLPALPTMATDLGVSTTQVARSVPTYFIGLVFGQLFYGPFFGQGWAGDAHVFRHEYFYQRFGHLCAGNT